MPPTVGLESMRYTAESAINRTGVRAPLAVVCAVKRHHSGSKNNFATHNISNISVFADAFSADAMADRFRNACYTKTVISVPRSDEAGDRKKGRQTSNVNDFPAGLYFYIFAI